MDAIIWNKWTDWPGISGRFHRNTQKDTLRPATVGVVQDNLTLIDTINQQLEVLEKNIQRSPEQAHAIALLMSMPGVGKITATTIVAEIGDIARFGSSKSLCNWAGLTPRVRKSDEIVRHGKISKQGSPYLRAGMVRAATAAVKKSKRWRTVFNNLSRRSGKRAARVAVARRLLAVAYHMLMRNEPYQEDYGQKGHSDRGA